MRPPIQNGDPPGIILAEFGILSGNGNNIRLDADGADMERAAEYPPLGWSGFDRFYGTRPGKHLTREIFDTAPLRGLDPTTRYERQWRVDPISFALYEAGAPAVNSAEFWMPNGDEEKEYPLRIRPFRSTDCLAAEFAYAKTSMTNAAFVSGPMRAEIAPTACVNRNICCRLFGISPRERY